MLVEGFRPGVMARLGLDDAAVAGAQPRHRLLLHLRVRAGGAARRAPGPRRQLPGLGGGADPRGRDGRHPAAAGGRPGVRPDRRLRDLRGGDRPQCRRGGGLPRRLHDRRAGHLDGDPPERVRRAGPRQRRCPATASSPPRTAGRWRWGSSTSSTSGRPCARELGWTRWPASTSTGAAAAAAELQDAVAAAVATRGRDELVGVLAAAGVPVAPVLDRQGMLARARSPPSPSGWPSRTGRRPVPALDQHRGQGFGHGA